MGERTGGCGDGRPGGRLPPRWPARRRAASAPLVGLAGAGGGRLAPAGAGGPPGWVSPPGLAFFFCFQCCIFNVFVSKKTRTDPPNLEPRKCLVYKKVV